MFERTARKRLLIAGLICWSVSMSQGMGRTLNVPEDYGTIEAAMNAADPDDTVMVAPGSYRLRDYTLKTRITLASWFLKTGDRSYIDRTILGGGALTIESDGTKVEGFTWTSEHDAIIPRAKIDLQHCTFRTSGDAVDYERGSGGYLAHCLFENNGDDGIDLDGDVDITIEHNVIRNNDDDGIEIRLQAYEGPLVTYIIRYNVITGNSEDGIQLIDYPGISSRLFYIHNNLVVNNLMVGVGSMPDGNSREDYGGSPQVERVYLHNNTIVGNDHGITGGHNWVAFNNIISDNKRLGAKNVDGNSILAHTLFHDNGADQRSCNLGEGILFADPLFDDDFRLLAGSPCIDTGVSSFEELQVTDYEGDAPDLGAHEHGLAGAE